MDDSLLPAVIFGLCAMCASWWLVGGVPDRSDVPSFVGGLSVTAEDDEEPADSAKALKAEIEAAQTDLERQKRELAWEAETLRLRHLAQLRDLEYRQRLLEDEAEEARRKSSDDVARLNATIERQRQEQARLRRLAAARDSEPAEERVVVQYRPVYVTAPTGALRPARPLPQQAGLSPRRPDDRR